MAEQPATRVPRHLRGYLVRSAGDRDLPLLCLLHDAVQPGHAGRHHRLVDGQHPPGLPPGYLRTGGPAGAGAGPGAGPVEPVPGQRLASGRLDPGRPARLDPGRRARRLPRLRPTGGLRGADRRRGPWTTTARAPTTCTCTSRAGSPQWTTSRADHRQRSAAGHGTPAAPGRCCVRVRSTSRGGSRSVPVGATACAAGGGRFGCPPARCRRCR